MRKFYYNFLNLLAPFFKGLNKRKLRVLAYHNVKDQEVFSRQIQYLENNYNIINIDKVKSHLFNEEPLPDYPLLITFDDGDISVLEKGIKVLEKYKLPSCLFIISGLINSNINYWADTVRINERESGKSETEIKNIVKDLKNLSNKERLEILQKYPQTLKKQLTLLDIKELNKKQMFIANHSFSHPMFNRCTKEELEDELDQTKKLFKKWNINGYSIFAYPNGNHNLMSEKVLEEKNIEIAFLFDHNINSLKINPLKISRLRVDSDTPLPEYKAKVSGLHSLLYRIRN